MEQVWRTVSRIDAWVTDDFYLRYSLNAGNNDRQPCGDQGFMSDFVATQMCKHQVTHTNPSAILWTMVEKINEYITMQG